MIKVRIYAGDPYIVEEYVPAVFPLKVGNYRALFTIVDAEDRVVIRYGGVDSHETAETIVALLNAAHEFQSKSAGPYEIIEGIILTGFKGSEYGGSLEVVKFLKAIPNV